MGLVYTGAPGLRARRGALIRSGRGLLASGWTYEKGQVVHFNVTDSPAAQWTGRQLVHAFPWDTAPRFLLRDRDAIYGPEFLRSASNLGNEDVRTSPQSPWQNPYVERLIGSIRRECLDHVVIVNEQHLRRVLREYVRYYSDARTHLASGKTRRRRGRLSHRKQAESSRSPRSAVCTTATPAAQRRNRFTRADYASRETRAALQRAGGALCRASALTPRVLPVSSTPHPTRREALLPTPRTSTFRGPDQAPMRPLGMRMDL